MVTEEDTGRQLKKSKPSNMHEPRAWRWLDLKPLASESQTKVIDKETNFCIRPFPYIPRGVFSLSMLEEANVELKLLHGRMHRTSTVFGQ